MAKSSLTPEQRIHEYIPLANRSGKRFAWKYQKYEPECQAEARFILTSLCLEQPELLDKAENEEVFLKIVFARRLRDYFKTRSSSEQVGIHPIHGQMVGELKPDHTSEITIYDYMDTLFPMERGLIDLWRRGFSLDEMQFLNPHAKKIVNDMIGVRRILMRTIRANAKAESPEGQAA